MKRYLQSCFESLRYVDVSRILCISCTKVMAMAYRIMGKLVLLCLLWTPEYLIEHTECFIVVHKMKLGLLEQCFLQAPCVTSMMGPKSDGSPSASVSQTPKAQPQQKQDL